MPLPIDYSTQPIGSIPGEEGLRQPYNARPVDVLVSVRNVSALYPRRIVVDKVSFRRGGEKLLNSKEAKDKFGHTSVDQLRQRVANGENLDMTEERVQPLDFIVRHDSKRYLVPAVDADGNPAPWVKIEPGVWDLYMGNWDRMHSPSPKERSDEIVLLQGRNLNRFVYGEEGSEFGFLEFKRERIEYVEATVDKDRVATGQLIEV